MEAQFIIDKITKNDLAEVTTLALNNGGGKKFTKAFIENWYLGNPSNSTSLCKVVSNEGQIEGYATTNNFMFVIAGEPLLVAMPQNVLTSVKVRGKGLFNKLYFKTESDNLNENKVDLFLTFTNKLSTPIFLNKFDYKRGKCPDLLFLPLNVFDFFSSYECIKLSSVDDILFFDEMYQFDNAMQKNAAHFKWRYSSYSKEELHIIAVKEKNKIIGYLFLQVQKKKGIKFLILMDVICTNENNFSKLIDAGSAYSTKNFFAGILLFDGAFKLRKRFLKLRIKNRLNFLVKGKVPEITDQLSKMNFNFFFGDLDMV
jgi:hypothetical protein